MNKVLVKIFDSSGWNCLRFRTYDRSHGERGRFFILKDRLERLLDKGDGAVDYDSDCGNYVEILHNKDRFCFRFIWLTLYGDDSVKGFQQVFEIPDRIIRSCLESGQSARFLYNPVRQPCRIDASRAAATMSEITRDKHLRRAFSKAMRDCMNWPGETVTLYRDFGNSFYFSTRSGYPKCGGLVLHHSTREGHPCIYYSVHT